MSKAEMDGEVQRARKLKDAYRPTIDSNLDRTMIEGPNYRIIIEHKEPSIEIVKRKKLVI